jgi:hypothetical protein
MQCIIIILNEIVKLGNNIGTGTRFLHWGASITQKPNHTRVDGNINFCGKGNEILKQFETIGCGDHIAMDRKSHPIKQQGTEIEI